MCLEGASSGEGAIFRWSGNADVGEGSMTIIESQPPERVRIDLHFLKPFEDTAVTEFTIKPAGDRADVTWSMDGQNNFMSKAFCLFMDMDKMIGDKYEKGLAKIKTIVENPPAEPSSESPAEQAVENRAAEPTAQSAEGSSDTSVEKRAERPAEGAAAAPGKER